MFRNKLRALAVAVAAAVALTTVSLTPAQAGRRGDAAMAGAVIGLFGTIAAIAAANAARDRYYDGYGYAPAYGYGPVYAAPPPVYVPPHGGHRHGWRGGHPHHRHWHR